MKHNILSSQHIRVAEVQLMYKSKVKPADRVSITSSKETFELLRTNWNWNLIELQEEFKVLFLNRGNQVLGMLTLSTGGMSGTVVDPKLLFVAAIKAAASAIVICHNHPSGQLTPSRADVTTTARIKLAGEFLDIRLLDHLIISREHYFSFADEGLL